MLAPLTFTEFISFQLKALSHPGHFCLYRGKVWLEPIPCTSLPSHVEISFAIFLFTVECNNNLAYTYSLPIDCFLHKPYRMARED